MDVSDNDRSDYLHTDLAPAYGTITKESVQELDDHLKVMISGTLRTLKSIPEGQRDWDKIMDTLMQTSILELDTQGQVDRTDSFIKRGQHVFRFDGSPDAAIVKEVGFPHPTQSFISFDLVSRAGK